MPRHQEVRLAPAVTAGLAALARSRELTLNSLVQGAWGLLLARHDGQPSGEGGARDVVFGTVVSGRPAELPGVESMVGLFINTLPARLRVDPAAPLAAWLAGVQALLLELRQRETVPLAEIQRLSERPTWRSAPVPRRSSSARAPSCAPRAPAPRRMAITGLESLTPAERRVVDLAGAGTSNADIAGRCSSA